MKTSKRFLALMLSALMIFSVVFIPGADLSSLLGIKADAAITLGGITQQRVVSNYESIYRQYQERFFTGAESNEPTNFVIPGLSSSNDYTPQGMTYWEEKEWILISAYDASGAGKHSVIYALDAVTTEFVALFKILNSDGSVNTSHGGGIAASKYNFYYADTASKISYIPLSEMDVTPGTVKEIKLKGSINCGGELGGAATSYCCYEDGVLWAGNFYYSGDDRYKTSAHSASDSMIVGYRLHGNSSAEEWYYLSTNYNLIKLNTDSTDEQTIGTLKIRTYNTDGANAEVRGTITTDAALGEVTHSFATLNLTEGKKYKVEFIADNNLSDLYMFAPNGGGHCNVKQSQASKITDLGNGKYHYQMIFTAGLKPAGADSLWPTTQSTNGTYTGTYTMRFDQDNVPAGGRTFNMTDISVTEYVEPGDFTPNSNYEGTGCAGNPTYVVMIAGIDKIQYAMVYKGKFYISRSWKRLSGTNHTRELMIGDIDLNSPGTANLVINGRTRPCHIININNVTRFGGDNGSSNLNQMFYMGEALCVIEDYLYMFGEGAAWAYNGKESSKCPEPIDVIWKIDQHMIMGEERTYDDTAPQYYQKINSLSQINLNDDYLIVHESSLKDPVTQKNILYAFDSFGGYGANKLPKQDAGTQANSADSMGMIGYKISDYSIDTDEEGNQIIYVPEEVDTTKSLHWQIQGATTENLRINNKDLYYAKNNHLYFGSRLFAMTTDARTNLNLLTLEQVGGADSGNFNLYYKGAKNYYLWCNDGSNPEYINAYTDYYSNHGKSGYVPQYHGTDEVIGTFHCDAGSLHAEATNSGNIMRKDVGEDMKTIHIYKRVADPYSSAYETRVSTDLTAELQNDGTYNIKLETYAISELQYQTVEERPTDFIFVLDTSGSMDTQDCNGYHRHNSFQLDAVSNQDAGDVGDVVNDSTNSNTIKTYDPQRMWIQHTDGVMCPIGVKVQGDGVEKSWIGTVKGRYQRIYLWYTHPSNGQKYWYNNNTKTWTTTETTYDNALRIYGTNDKNRGETNVFSGVCYEKRTDSSRLSNMQIAVNQLIWKIQEKAQSTGLDHRVALVQYGSNSSGSWTNMGMYTNSSTSRVPYTGDGTINDANYKNAFHSVSQFNNAKNIVNNLTASGDTFVDFGFDMAHNIIANSDATYTADGNRSACVIMITDGCPGFGGDDSSTANTVANEAIKNAAEIKKAGGYIYTIQMGNNSMSGFDMDKYMDYTSSEFLFAKSMSEPGDRNTKDIAYKIDVPIAGFNLDFLVNSIFESVTSNSTNAIATLNANSILREHLTDAFIIPEGTKPEIKVAMADYDGIGRLYFEDPTSPTDTITATINTAENEILVSGYDYSTRFVSKSNVAEGLSQKLIVTIKGVIANADAELTNTSINNTTNTAIYQNNEFMSKNSAVKRFPTEYFTIPEYTYILDYGIGMYDNDINGKLLSVDSEPCKQDTYKKVLKTDNIGMTFTNSDLDMIYNVLPHADGKEATSRGYCLIERDDGTYDWFRINILPASNVYYEEFHGTNQSNGSYVKWTHNTSDMKEFNQVLTGEHDIYGYDINYLNDKSAFSYGSAYKSEVSAENGKNRTESIKFNYTGSAIDIVASCGEETGIYIVTVKNGNTVEKVYIVDTYFTDSAILNGIDQLNQVPIIHHENKDNNGEMLYGTHSVEITSVYLSSMIGARKAASTMSLRGSEDITYYSADITEEAKEAILELSDMEYLLDEDIEVIFFDENSVLNGGTGVEGASDVNAYATFSMRASEPERDFTTLKNYFDGFRVYNALADNSFSYVESEQGATYYNVINSLATANSFLTGQGNNFVGYLEGDDEATIKFADYKKTSAPTNEVYLANNTSAISFKVPQGYQKLMVSFRAVTGEPKAKIGGQEPSQFAVIGATEMYYDITSYVGEDGLVTIQNSGTGLLAINNIKVVNGALMPAMMSMLPRVRMMMAAPAADVEPNVPDDNTGDVNFPGVNDGTVVPGSDLDLDAEGFIPDYVPEENVNDSDSILNIFEDILAEIKSFFDMIIRFFKTLFA